MDESRRRVVCQGSMLAILMACGVVTMRQALAAEAAGFEAKTLDDALAAVGGKPVDSKDITLTSPDIAENGAVVPLTVATTIPKAEAIYILVEKNPFPLAASFTIPDGTDPFIVARVKMGETSRVVAVVKADGKLYSTAKETKVTLGGCGG